MAASAASVRGDFLSSPGETAFLDSNGDTTLAPDGRIKGNVVCTNPPEIKGKLRLNAGEMIFYDPDSGDTTKSMRTGDIGQGNFGVVYKSSWSGSQVAIKTIDNGPSMTLSDSNTGLLYNLVRSEIFTRFKCHFHPFKCSR